MSWAIAGGLDVSRSVSGLEVLVRLAGGHLLADGHLVLLPDEARALARHLINAASEAELAARLALEHAGPSGHSVADGDSKHG